MTDKLVVEFVNELKTAKYWCKPDGKPFKEWVLFERDTLEEARTAAWAAAGNAAGIAARTVSWAASWTAAWDAKRTAAKDASSDAAWDAKRTATWAAASDTALDATGSAAGSAAVDATGSVSLFAGLLVVRDLDIPFKHFSHANERMRVWRKGYCLLCDVKGKLYVYAKKVKQ